MTRLTAAERLAREIDPSEEALTKRESWSLLSAKANVGLGYSPEVIAARTGWPVMMLTTSVSQARKTWNAMQEAKRLAEVHKAERLEAERQAAQDAEEEAMLIAAAREREANRSDGRRVVALMREHGLTVEDLIRLIERARPEEELVPGDVETEMADVLVETLERAATASPREEPAPKPVARPAPEPAPVQTPVQVSAASTDYELTPLEQFMAATEPPEAQVIQLNAKKIRKVDRMVWANEALSFVEQYGMKEFIEAAAYYPTSIDIDPHQADVDYPIERRRRGDMEVSIGFRNENEPMILFVHLFTGEVTHRQSAGAPVGKGKKNAGLMSTHYPMTANDLIKRAQEQGFMVAYGKEAELRWKDGRVAMRVPRGTADRKEIVRSWTRLQDWLRANTEGGGHAAAH